MISEESFVVITVVITLGIAFLIYLIPTFIAKSRKHENFGWILFLNIFFGWTGILWVVLILWAGLGAKKEIYRYKGSEIKKF